MATPQLIFGQFGSGTVLKVVDTTSPNVNTDETLTSSRHWSHLAHDGAGTYVAANDDDSYLAYSTDDGATWAETIPSPVGGPIVGSSLVWDGTQFTVDTWGGSGTSPDGSTWTFTERDFTVFWKVFARGMWAYLDNYGKLRFTTDIESAGQLASTDTINYAIGQPSLIWSGNYRRLVTNGTMIIVLEMDGSSYSRPKYTDLSDYDFSIPLEYYDNDYNYNIPTLTDCTYDALTIPDPFLGWVRMRACAWNGTYWLGVGTIFDSGAPAYQTDRLALAYSTDGIDWEWDYGWGEHSMYPSDVMWDGTNWWITAMSSDFLAPVASPSYPNDSCLFKYAPGSPVLSGTLTRYDPSGAQGTGYIGIAGYPNPRLYDHQIATGDGLAFGTSPLTVDVFLAATGDGLDVSTNGTAILSGTQAEDSFVLDFRGGITDSFVITDALGSTAIDVIDFSGLSPSFTIDPSHITQSTFLDFREPVRKLFVDVMIEEPIYNRTTYPNGVRRPIRMVLVQPDLTYVGELTGFNLESNIDETLNEIDDLDFKCSINNNNRDILTVPDVEVQVWRGTRIAWWGPIEKAEADGDFIKCHAKSLSWYFTRRHFGKANRTNLLLNPRFENGLKMWNTNTLILKPEVQTSDNSYVGTVTPQMTTGVNDRYDPEYAHGYSQWPNLLGRHSLRISNPNYVDGSFSLFQWYTMFTSSFDLDTLSSMTQCIHQMVEVDGGPNGNKCAFVCWLYIPEIIPDYGFSAENPMGSGISLSRMDAAFDPVTDNWFNKILETKSTNVTKTHEKNRWVRHVVELDIPANIVCKVWARIEGPYGQFHADACSVTMDEGLENVSPEGDDQASLFARIVEHAQDAAFEKSDLSITAVTPATPIKRIKKWSYKDHRPTWEALSEFPTLYDGMDFWWVYAPTYRAIVTSHPRRGVPRPGLVFELGANIVEARIITNGKDTANQIVLLSPLGSDSGREEASATDTSIFNAGLTLEKIYTGTPGADIGTLDAQAQRGLARFKDGVVVPEITVADPEGHLWWEIVVGNIHRVKIDYGWINVDEEYRIIKKSLDHEASTITLTLNPEFV